MMLIWQLCFRINLPYENERFFDENNNIVYKSQTIIVLYLLLVLNIFSIMFLLLFKYKSKKLNK